MKSILITLLLVLVSCKSTESVPRPENDGKKYNILFLSIDDMRPELGCYGVDYVKSPNIDRLASESVLFKNAFCQQAICNPSRASLLTGMYPDQIQVWDLVTNFRSTKGGRNRVTLPQFFKNNNYTANWTGKIFHPGMNDDVSWHNSLSLWKDKSKPYHRKYRYYSDKTNAEYDVLSKRFEKKHKRKPYFLELWRPALEAVENSPDSEWVDAIIADSAIHKLRDLKKESKPFFLAVGLVKTHLPFTAPKKYYDLYDKNKIPLPTNPNLPLNMPPMAMNTGSFIRSHLDLKRLNLPSPHNGKVNEAVTRDIRHAYLACVSFVDTQVGRILDELERLDLKKNTIICLWGDHGYKLGEYRGWSKMTNFDVDTRCPFIIYHPDAKTKGLNSSAMVEFVDIYPTLVDLAGYKVPKHLPGKSLKPLILEPDLKWDNVALSQYLRGGMRSESYDGKFYMGYSIRSENFRYAEWFEWDNEKKLAGRLVAKELYDFRSDSLEKVNFAGVKKYSKIEEAMKIKLQEKRAEHKDK